LHLYGAPWANTPVLDGLRDDSLIFTDISAQAPVTAESVLALQCSTYPRTDALPTVEAMPGLRVPDLAGVLGQHGYRRAFLCQTLRGWQGKNYCKDRHFEYVADNADFWSDNSGRQRLNDLLLADQAFRWVDTQVKGAAFFLMLWTYQTHYPFYVNGPVEEFEPGRTYLNRYLTAIRDSDRLVDRIVEELKRRGLWDSTLVVITGDHGQSFRSGTDTRGGRDLSEYSLRVPLVVLKARRLARAGTDATLGQHIDLPPTVLDMLGWEAPAQWQGQSLFARPRPGRVFYMNNLDWKLSYGLRDGPLKFIACGGDRALYDLADDPLEQHNLADAHPEACARYYEELVAWHRFQQQYLEQFRP
jgi:arylsulfatase A-like enzyme